MPPAPTTENPANEIDAGEAEYDGLLGVYTLFFVVPRADVVYVRLVIESWEDFAVPRTMDRFHEGDRARQVVVVLAVPDYIGPCVRRLARLCGETGSVQIPTSPLLREALRRDLLGA
jgi:hypothetical protein